MLETVRTIVMGAASPSIGVVALSLGLAISGCSQTVEPETGSGFPVTAAREVFADGYRHVRERYIEPVRVDELALAGLAGLEQLAPDLTIQSEGRQISVLASGQRIGTFERPYEDDSEGWADLTAAVLRTGYSSSEQLRQMHPEELYSGIFSGMLTKLDGYSRYTDAATSEDARASRDGFGGIGVTVSTLEGQSTIMMVLPDGPAARAGIREKDRIVAIDGQPMVDTSHDELIHLLRGREGSELTLTVERGTPAKRLTMSLIREHIVPQTVWYRRDGNIAHFRISSFNRQTTSELSRLVGLARTEIGPEMAGLVLDLRGNPGGLLDQAVGVADLFLSKGTIIATRGRHPASNSSFTATADDIAEGLPIVVLINGRSASASEILAAALQDQGRAVVVGSNSHGKGSVQNVARMPNGGEFIITWSRLVAPSGYILDRLGVTPSVCTSGGGAAGPDSVGVIPVATVNAWHSYAIPDEAIARTLRLGCPAVGEEQSEDLRLAERVLRDGQLYAQALRPWVGTVTASTDS